MDNSAVQKLKEAITKSNSIGIAVGANPSLDQMAAALSLYLLLQQTQKKVTVASPTNPIVEISSLVGINKVQNSFGGDAGDLVVSFPYVEGEIEKVSYTLEEGFLNIIVKASEQGLSFDEKDVRYTRGSGNVDLLFVIGTARLSDLGTLFDTEKFRNTRVINIDNNEANQRFGDIVLVSPQVSSLSEQIADIALLLGFQVDRDAAQNLLSGITHATKNFQDPATSSLAFEMASLLMKKGAIRVRSNVPPRTERSDVREDRPQNPAYTQRLQQARQQHSQQSPQPQQSRNEDRPRSVSNQHSDQRPPRDQRDQDTRGDQSGDEKPPVDWLSPKVYKGSSNF